jgi:hypothetical protein
MQSRTNIFLPRPQARLITLALFTLAFFMLSGCQKSKGIVVDSIAPPQMDITTEAALQGDDVLQQIIISQITNAAGTPITGSQQAFYIRNSLRDALTATQVFNFVDSSTLPNVPSISVAIQDFGVDPDATASGYTTRRGHAAVNFSLLSTEKHIVGSTTETAEIVNRQPVGTQLTPHEELKRELADDVCREFVSKLVPTKKREFREFASGGSTVQKGMDAAFVGDWELAMEFWNEAAEKDPEDDAAWYNMGIGYEAMHNLRRALRSYAKARRLDPGNELYSRTYAKLKSKLSATRHMEQIKEDVREGNVGAAD